MSPRDLAKELDDTPDDAPSSTTVWRPAVGDTVIGRVVARDTVESKFDDTPVERLEITEDDGGGVIVFGNQIVLRDLIAKKNPRVGDRIAIKRIADLEGKAYRRYRMIVDRADDPDPNLGF